VADPTEESAMSDGSGRLLVLWDIDHTLVDGGGVSRDAYVAAFERTTGRPFEQLTDMTGKTELMIGAETLRLHGIEPEEGVLRALTDAVGEELVARAEQLKQAGRRASGSPQYVARR